MPDRPCSVFVITHSVSTTQPYSNAEQQRQSTVSKRTKGCSHITSCEVEIHGSFASHTHDINTMQDSDPSINARSTLPLAAKAQQCRGQQRRGELNNFNTVEASDNACALRARRT